MTEEKISVFLVDDHHMVRSGIKTELLKNENVVIAGEASNGKEALEKLEKVSPDIVLMDISMPEMNGLKATELIRKRLPNTKVIALTMHDSKNYVSELMRLGANGYVLKDSGPEELLEAIESVNNNVPYYSSKINIEMLKEEMRKNSQKSYVALLTPREEDVLRLLVNGYSNKEIAKALKISVRTVETHRDHLTKKLDIKSVSELTKYAISQGLDEIRK